MRLLLPVAALAAALLAPPAAQASCAIQPPRDARIAEADAALVGTVVAREGSVYTFQVERAVKGALGERLRVRDESPASSIGLNLPIGARVGLLLRADRADATGGDGADYVANDCRRIGPDELVAAAVEAPDCEAGDRPAVRYRSRRYALRPRVLACGRTPGGTAFQLVGYRLKGRARPCLDLVRLPAGPAAGCGDGRIRDGGLVDVDGRSGPLLSGTANPNALGGVAVRYRDARAPEMVRHAALVHVDGERTLRRLRIPRPFATWVADFPRGATASALEPRSWHGEASPAEPLG